MKKRLIVGLIFIATFCFAQQQETVLDKIPIGYHGKWVMKFYSIDKGEHLKLSKYKKIFCEVKENEIYNLKEKKKFEIKKILLTMDGMEPYTLVQLDKNTCWVFSFIKPGYITVQVVDIDKEIEIIRYCLVKEN